MSNNLLAKQTKQTEKRAVLNYTADEINTILNEAVKANEFTSEIDAIMNSMSRINELQNLVDIVDSPDKLPQGAAYGDKAIVLETFGGESGLKQNYIGPTPSLYTITGARNEWKYSKNFTRNLVLGDHRKDSSNPNYNFFGGRLIYRGNETGAWSSFTEHCTDGNETLATILGQEKIKFLLGYNNDAFKENGDAQGYANWFTKNDLLRQTDIDSYVSPIFEADGNHAALFGHIKEDVALKIHGNIEADNIKPAVLIEYDPVYALLYDDSYNGHYEGSLNTMVNEICHFELDVIEAVLNETPQINLITDNIGADYSLLSLVEVIKNDASNIYRYQYINSCFNLIATVDIHIKEDNLSIDVIGEWSDGYSSFNEYILQKQGAYQRLTNIINGSLPLPQLLVSATPASNRPNNFKDGRIVTRSNDGSAKRMASGIQHSVSNADDEELLFLVNDKKLTPDATQNYRVGFLFGRAEPTEKIDWTTITDADTFMHIKDGQVAFGKKIPDKKRLEYDIDAEGKTFRAKSINALDIVYSGNLSKNNEVVVPLTKNEYNKVEKIINNFSINPISESTIMYLGDNAILSCLNEDGSIKIGDPDTDLIFNGARTIIKSDFFGKENSDGSRDAVVFESDLPTSTSDLINDSGFITLQDVDLSGYDDTEIRLLIDEKASTKFVTSEVSALDSAIWKAQTDISEVSLLLKNKVDKEEGKGLSTNDYTTNEKNKLSALATPSWVQVNSASITVNFSHNMNNRYRAVTQMCTDILFRYKSGAYPVKDTAEVDLTFLTGETAPTVSYLDTLDNSTDRRIYFTGDDCIGGDFQPQPMTMYNVFLWWSGMDYQGVVRASEYDPISVVMTLEEDDLLE